MPCHASQKANAMTDKLVHLFRIRLNSGGYDTHGCYWGHGAPIYAYYVPEESDDQHTLRAASRDKAKEMVRHWHGHHLQFFR